MNIFLLVLSALNWAFVYFDYTGGNVNGWTIFTTAVASVLMTQWFYQSRLDE